MAKKKYKESIAVEKALFALVLLLAAVLTAGYFADKAGWLTQTGVIQEYANIQKDIVDEAIERFEDFFNVVTDSETESEPSFANGTFRFEFNEKVYHLTPSVSEEVYQQAIALDRTFSVGPQVDRTFYTQAYYNNLVFAELQAPAIEDVSTQLRAIRDTEGLDSDSYAELICKFVQSVPYDMAKLKSENSFANGDPRLPVQVLTEGLGDCDENAMLAGALLAHEGYGVALLTFPEDGHAALGIASEGPGYKDCGYEYVEMTAPSYPSEIPDQMLGGITVTTAPIVLPFTSGGTAYSAAAVDQVNAIAAARNGAEAALEVADGYEQQKACSDAMKYLIQHVDAKGNLIDAYKDRVPAYAWVLENAWWVK